ncbi:hypothetical protein EIN_427870 [Entamoeba invadens IP1]|uniref:Myb-like domain-containing protein n=1 Tax=Entamoeba invadens IP1 TaxID=370355 RepID=A0A0A1UEV1_ENTIV|nr:hypothetical protein EIN_427870 [Entamoeba invadens IP1]ELP95121.1 hypothetical protein EIN_427870 [Entamoeba invadens IP1]|eukprot:XP_004261892.1 hypothetical protein EIN_427870 [Entamoeba invadens IP1]
MWTTTEQLVLIESIQYCRPQSISEWKYVSDVLIKTLCFDGPVDASKFTERECLDQFKSLEKMYEEKIPPQYPTLAAINFLLRRKRIEELDEAIFQSKQNLMKLQQIV